MQRDREAGQRIHVGVEAPASVGPRSARASDSGSATSTVDGEPVGRVPLVAARYRFSAADADSLAARADDVVPGPRAVVWVLVASAWRRS